MKVLFDINQIKRVNNKFSLGRFCDISSIENKKDVLAYLRSFTPTATSPHVLRDPITNVYYRALYAGSTTLTDLVSVMGFPLDHEFYKVTNLRRMSKKLQ